MSPEFHGFIAPALLGLYHPFMEGPWFRRFGAFGYRPIAWQGVAICVAQLVFCISCFKVSERYEHSNPVLEWGFGGVGVLIFCALFAVIIWKTDMDYRS